jgi:hypothetical protein
MEYEHENAIDQAMPMEVSHEDEMAIHTSILLDILKSVTRLEMKVDELCDEMEDSNSAGAEIESEGGPYSEQLETQIFADISNQFDLIGF